MVEPLHTLRRCFRPMRVKCVVRVFSVVFVKLRILTGDHCVVRLLDLNAFSCVQDVVVLEQVIARAAVADPVGRFVRPLVRVQALYLKQDPIERSETANRIRAGRSWEGRPRCVSKGTRRDADMQW